MLVLKVRMKMNGMAYSEWIGMNGRSRETKIKNNNLGMDVPKSGASAMFCFGKKG